MWISTAQLHLINSENKTKLKKKPPQGWTAALNYLHNVIISGVIMSLTNMIYKKTRVSSQRIFTLYSIKHVLLHMNSAVCSE